MEAEGTGIGEEEMGRGVEGYGGGCGGCGGCGGWKFEFLKCLYECFIFWIPLIILSDFLILCALCIYCCTS